MSKQSGEVKFTINLPETESVTSILNSLLVLPYNNLAWGTFTNDVMGWGWSFWRQRKKAKMRDWIGKVKNSNLCDVINEYSEDRL